MLGENASLPATVRAADRNTGRYHFAPAALVMSAALESETDCVISADPISFTRARPFNTVTDGVGIRFASSSQLSVSGGGLSETWRPADRSQPTAKEIML